MVPVISRTENTEALLYIDAYRTSLNGCTLTFLGGYSNSRYALRSKHEKRRLPVVYISASITSFCFHKATNKKRYYPGSIHSRTPRKPPAMLAREH